MFMCFSLVEKSSQSEQIHTDFPEGENILFLEDVYKTVFHNYAK